MLASRSLSKTAKASVFGLPPNLRVSAWQQPTKRPFSASGSRQNNLLDIVVVPPIAVLTGFHSLGLPWFAVLPITAVLARGVFGYYFTSLPARRRAAIRNDLQPLITATVNIRMRQLEQRGDFRGPDGVDKRRRDERLGRFVNLWSVSRKFGAGIFSASSFVNFGTLIAFSEAVRLKAGAHDGLLAVVVAPFQWVASKISPGHFHPVQNASMDEIVRRLEAARAAAMETGQWSSDTSLDLNELSKTVQDTPVQKVESIYVDPSLQTEGFSWCPDLTVADPTGYIPFALFSVMAANILLRPQRKDRSFLMRYSPFQNLGLAASGLFFWMALQLPAGVTLYLASTMVVGAIQRRWLDVADPIRAPIVPCKRPTRIKVKKEWA